jgi:dephospho-CoA kinase
MHAIGLTGGFCAGKTFVLKVLEEQGCCTMRADDLAREIVFGKDSPVREEIAAALGPGVVDPERGLDKEKFSELLFADRKKREAVNAIVHPLVSAERRQRIRAIAETRLYDFLVYESALLLESGVYRDFERIIVVYAPEAVQVHRAMERDRLTKAEALKRIRSQFPLREKLKQAHYTIASGGTLAATRANTLEVFHLLKTDFHLP